METLQLLLPQPSFCGASDEVQTESDADDEIEENEEVGSMAEETV